MNDYRIDLPDEIIIEDEIVLDPIDRAIALDAYFNGQAPMSWGTSNLNLVSGVNVVGRKPEKRDTSYLYLFAGVVAAIFIAILFYYRFKN